jgi:hypothetical protein
MAREGRNAPPSARVRARAQRLQPTSLRRSRTPQNRRRSRQGRFLQVGRTRALDQRRSLRVCSSCPQHRTTTTQPQPPALLSPILLWAFLLVSSVSLILRSRLKLQAPLAETYWMQIKNRPGYSDGRTGDAVSRLPSSGEHFPKPL